MELFNYLMAKNDNNTSVRGDLFSYLLGKGQSGTYTEYTGTELSINNTKKGKMKVNLLGNTSQDSTTGKQLFNTNLLTSRNFNGVIITVDDDGKWKFNGTATLNGDIKLSMTNQESQKFANKVIYFNLKNNPPISTYFQLVVRTSGGSAKSYYVIPSNISSGSWDLTNESFSNGEYFEFFIYQTTSTPQINNVEYEVMISDTQNVPYEPYTGGIPSPNPSYPEDVHIVSGDNTITTTGKNLCSSFSRIGNQMYLNGTTSTTSYIFKAGTYTISYKNNSNSTAYVFMRKPSSSANESVDSGSPVTFTSDEDFNVWIYMSGMQDEDISEIQLEKSSSASSYTPYTSTSYPISLGDIELCKISTYQDRFLRNSGKQVWDEEWEVGAYAWSTGEKVVNYDTIRSKNKMPIKPSTTYYVTIPSEIVIEFFDSTNTFLGSSTNVNKNSSASFTTPSNASYFVLYMTSVYGTTYKNDIMINEGSSPLPYEPYGTNEWYLEKKIGKVVLNGTEEYNQYSTTTKFFTTLNDALFTSGILIICNKYLGQVSGSGGDNKDNYTCWLQSEASYKRLYFRNDTCNSVSDFETAMTSEQPIVYYPLATPTYTKITDSTLITQLDNVYRANSYKGQTNISQVNDDLPFNLDLEVKVGS